ncbi:ABC transporter ATP-binding protein [Lactococcus piscium]|uniref:ABC transporter ATP-binding protein n=1 Tax=Pseudolactococcus carnosus TaxID=2749961 RepID=UPI000BCCBFAE|nr:ABC transporter ATP-binding protein [Lactococcus carnosus]SOB47382.1 ABC transporter ATP-binding protein [Lactococcus piscium]MCJ1974585.1 ABC transporter ATP-binding protein [Lactococcus carnosus]MCJ1978785.1 ABC transporter ATP-binding protein [Lactococcus carnosus]MCJ1985065.1 ABC transporter ATP-binding protein [Lactococcus carnosus]MCJ2002944.1 ABC transporter ATP-binding protein [Lactococcus carnosus]
MENRIISVNHITKEIVLGKSKNKIKLIDDISFEINKGEFLSIVGPSGSGKSTLLNIISGLSTPTTGTVSLESQDIYKLSPTKLARLRREKIGFIFQQYNLLSALPVFENITLQIRLSHKKIDKDQIDQLLERINFEPKSAARINSLSGGEKQKVAIARVLATNCEIIFADEPTGALDSVSREKVFSMLRELTQLGKTVIMVTHDIEMASRTDRAVIIRDGKIQNSLSNPTETLILHEMGGEI